MKTYWEVGKTYKMVGGGIATVEKITKRLLIGTSNVPYVKCWKLNGVYSAAIHDYDLTRTEVSVEVT